MLYYITLDNYNHVYKLTSRGELSQIMGVDLPAYRMWGNDIEAPKGQDPDEDMFVSLVLLKGEKKASLAK